MSGYDAVVNASGFEDVRLAQRTVEQDAIFVDITATSTYYAELEKVDRPLLLGVGLASGITSVLAAEAHRLGSGPVEIVVGLGGGELHGPVTTAWTYGMSGTWFPDPNGFGTVDCNGPQRFRPDAMGVGPESVACDCVYRGAGGAPAA